MLFPVLSRTSCLAVATAFLSAADAAPQTSAASPAGQGATPNLTVDLGYGVYKGVHNTSTNLNVWKGIRYAAPPTGRLRWQAPQTPAVNRTVVTADQFGPICPQANPAIPGLPFPGLHNEDCLYLNVYAPAPSSSSAADSATAAAGFPVYVYIHGGGYGGGDGTTDISGFMNTNNNNFVGVTIQYRLGVFGFASSNDIKNRGVLNAGLLDQAFALQWVQNNIKKFGGDPSRVTIAGESAGAGSVMLHAIARNGALGTKWFKNIIAASPYLPGQAKYNDPIPTGHYYDFAKFVGCPSSGPVFDCLVSKDTATLQYANNNITVNPPTPFANWAFIPVTDGTYITGLPSKQLGQKKVNGLRMLVGNNAEEGALFVYGGINTQDNLTTWIKQNYPNLSNANVSQIIAAYPSTSAPVNPNDPKFATSGIHPPTAINVSQAGTGQQQRAYNIYAESTFVCPSYWMASAFTQPSKSAWHYQWSVPFAFHASDLSVYFGPAGPNVGPDMVTAFRKIYGNFIVNNNPSISAAIANGASVPSTSNSNPASNWPLWTDTNPMQVNLNQTGGTPFSTNVIGFNVVEYQEPGLRNAITVANAYTWEGGRGQRCDFWKQMSPYVPQ